MALTYIGRREMQSFMLHHLDECSLIQKEIRERILFLLHSPGKLFHEHTRFCWGGVLYLYREISQPCTN